MKKEGCEWGCGCSWKIVLHIDRHPQMWLLRTNEYSTKNFFTNISEHHVQNWLSAVRHLMSDVHGQDQLKRHVTVCSYEQIRHVPIDLMEKHDHVVPERHRENENRKQVEGGCGWGLAVSGSHPHSTHTHPQVSFRESSLRNVDFTHAELLHMDFRNADLRGATIDNEQLFKNSNKLLGAILPNGSVVSAPNWLTMKHYGGTHHRTK
jgi:hypothetical protein